MNLDTSEFHIRAFVRDIMTDDAADKVLSDSTWLETKTHAYLQLVGSLTDAGALAAESAEFNAQLENELRERLPAESFSQD